MGPHYYYLTTSLPTLMPDADPEFSVEELVALCRRHVTGSCLTELENARITDHNTPPINALYAEWRAFDLELREQLVMLRSARQSRNAAEHLRREPIPPVFVTEQVQAIYAQENPRKAEELLFYRHWRILDDLDGRSFMRLDNLIIYSLKLQLIAQQRAMTAERGSEVLSAIRTDFAAQLQTWQAS